MQMSYGTPLLPLTMIVLCNSQICLFQVVRLCTMQCFLFFGDLKPGHVQRGHAHTIDHCLSRFCSAADLDKSSHSWIMWFPSTSAAPIVGDCVDVGLFTINALEVGSLLCRSEVLRST